MRQHLEVEGLVTLVAHAEHRLQVVLGQGHAVLQAELIRPSLLHVIAEIGSRKAKVETDRVIAALALVTRLRRRLAEVFPIRDASEAVLRQSGRGVVLGRRTEDLDGIVSTSCREAVNKDVRGRRREHHL